MGYIIIGAFVLVFTGIAIIKQTQGSFILTIPFWVILALYSANQSGTGANLFDNWNGWISVASIAYILVMVWRFFWGDFKEERNAGKKGAFEDYDYIGIDEDSDEEEGEYLNAEYEIKHTRRKSRATKRNKDKKALKEITRGIAGR